MPQLCRRLRALPEPERLEAFYTCWTRKEAFLKARGVGLSGRWCEPEARHYEPVPPSTAWQPVVTYWVNAKPRVSAAAVADVLTALDDWNAALSEAPAAPVLARASNRRNAEILIELDVIAAGPGRSKPSLAGSGSSRTNSVSP